MLKHYFVDKDFLSKLLFLFATLVCTKIRHSLRLKCDFAKNARFNEKARSLRNLKLILNVLADVDKVLSDVDTAC